MISYHCCDCGSRSLYWDVEVHHHYCYSCDKYVYAEAKKWE